MDDRQMYHEESRKLQDQFDTRRLADRLAERLVRSAFNDEDRLNDDEILALLEGQLGELPPVPGPGGSTGAAFLCALIMLTINE